MKGLNNTVIVYTLHIAQCKFERANIRFVVRNVGNLKMIVDNDCYFIALIIVFI